MGATPVADQSASLQLMRWQVPVSQWPTTDLRLTTVDCETGETVLRNREDGIDLATAIATSCAVPGYLPTASFNGGRTPTDPVYQRRRLARDKNSTRSPSSEHAPEYSPTQPRTPNWTRSHGRGCTSCRSPRIPPPPKSPESSSAKGCGRAPRRPVWRTAAGRSRRSRNCSDTRASPQTGETVRLTPCRAHKRRTSEGRSTAPCATDVRPGPSSSAALPHAGSTGPDGASKTTSCGEPPTPGGTERILKLHMQVTFTSDSTTRVGT